MPRRPRYTPADVPVHVVQRGNNRLSTFREPADYARYRAILDSARRRMGCSIHAYVLMTNHVHLLVTPARGGALSRMMQLVGQRYVRYFNSRYGRTGTLWEGRFRAASIDSERYFFTCARYIEMNPVRAGIARHPRDYGWSSFAANADGARDVLVEPHRLYAALGDTSRARAAAYLGLFATQPDGDAESVQLIRRATVSGRSLAAVSGVRVQTLTPNSDPESDFQVVALAGKHRVQDGH